MRHPELQNHSKAGPPAQKACLRDQLRVGCSAFCPTGMHSTEGTSIKVRCQVYPD